MALAIMSMPLVMADNVYFHSWNGLVELETDPTQITVTIGAEDGITLDSDHVLVKDKFITVYLFDVDSDEYRYVVENDIRRVEGYVIINNPERRDHDMYTGSYISVKLKNLEDIPILEKWMEKYDLRMIERSVMMPHWITVSVTPETGYDALEMSNIMYDSSDFVYSEPAFINDTHLDDPTYIEDVLTESEVNAYYDLQGRKVTNPEGGIYIERSGEKTRKVIIIK